MLSCLGQNLFVNLLIQIINWIRININLKKPYINTGRVFGKLTHFLKILQAYFIRNTVLSYNREKCNILNRQAYLLR